jgi:hypothetical protein
VTRLDPAVRKLLVTVVAKLTPPYNGMDVARVAAGVGALLIADEYGRADVGWAAEFIGARTTEPSERT